MRMSRDPENTRGRSIATTPPPLTRGAVATQPNDELCFCSNTAAFAPYALRN